MIKRVSLQAFENPRRGGILAIMLQESDRLVAVQATHGGETLLIATQDGNAAKFKEDDIRPMGRAAGGVRGIRLEEGDAVIGMEKVVAGDTVLTATEHGFGKGRKKMSTG